ncbi:hypothetical protein [Granulicella tundricola]|uniref:Uncharacterized protein n=1 Tax=Granulicella tundricola (strain ATCC BAA-1859 / DSM 23138 / MP5ACTX9) TaxID=1198114 RepID=E8X3H5_GRATM|nr:hypothetical protein [Granulicella tundricola]ADW68166.1 hypothetical protein AciX9_1103 [Granulicella tundricola MP5ACTX9]
MTPPQYDDWIATSATVTTCRFQFARMNTFTLGIQTQDKFRITFDYYAHGRLYSDEFQSPKAIPQNTEIPILYNPHAPEQNNRTSGPTATPTRTPIMAVGIAGSIILSLAWLLILRGCHP